MLLVDACSSGLGRGGSSLLGGAETMWIKVYVVDVIIVYIASYPTSKTGHTCQWNLSDYALRDYMPPISWIFQTCIYCSQK